MKKKAFVYLSSLCFAGSADPASVGSSPGLRLLGEVPLAGSCRKIRRKLVVRLFRRRPGKVSLQLHDDHDVVGRLREEVGRHQGC